VELILVLAVIGDVGGDSPVAKVDGGIAQELVI